MTDPGPFLPQSTFSTAEVAPEYRFEAWRAALASSHAIEAEPAGFFGRVHSVQVDGISVHCLDSSPVAIERSPARIRRDGLDHFVFHLSRHTVRASAAGQTLQVAPGSFSVNDLSRPTTRQSVPETASLVAVIPRQLMREAVDACDTFHGRVLHRSVGALLASHLRNLVDTAGTIPAGAGGPLARATADLAAACLDPTPRSIGRSAPAIEAARLARARAFIEANLSQPDLTPETIARAIGLSRSTLFRAFEQSGGISAYIWSQRLRAVHRALCDDRETRSIAQIGQGCGFTSGAHLSRAFRQEFGQTPRDVRQGGDSRTARGLRFN